MFKGKTNHTLGLVKKLEESSEAPSTTIHSRLSPKENQGDPRYTHRLQLEDYAGLHHMQPENTIYVLTTELQSISFVNFCEIIVHRRYVCSGNPACHSTAA